MGQVNFLLLGLGWVSHLWFGFGKFPQKIPNFPIFFLSDQKNCFGSDQKNTRVKDGLGSYLLRVKSMLVLGQGPTLISSDEYWPKIFDWGQVGSAFSRSRKLSSKKPIISILSYPGKKIFRFGKNFRVGPSFSAGQMNAQVRSCPISTNFIHSCF